MFTVIKDEVIKIDQGNHKLSITDRNTCAFQEKINKTNRMYYNYDFHCGSISVKNSCVQREQGKYKKIKIDMFMIRLETKAIHKFLFRFYNNNTLTLHVSVNI